jgi:hypothetical protein
MGKYKIGWLPGDGIGVEVLEAAKIVLDKLNLSAEYLPGEIGWDCWCKEGDSLPPRTLELLKNVDAALFGAITSKPAKTAMDELAPSLRNKGLTYRSPIVRMRQLFDLYICFRPCKAYPGNRLNFKENIDLVVFRENTEDLYVGVEFSPVPNELSDLLSKLSGQFIPFAKVPEDQYAISCKINTRHSSERIARAAFEFARKQKRKKSPSFTKPMSSAPPMASSSKLPQRVPGNPSGRRQHRRHDHVVAQEPLQLRCPPRSESLRRHHFRSLRPNRRRPRLWLLRQYRDQTRRFRTNSWLRPQVRRTIQSKSPGHHPGRQDDARVARRISMRRFA